ncbi:MAG: hypothetical protein AB4368_02595 [Xenococcaceae cyanobacterium]
MDNQKFTTLKERLTQIKQGGKYRSINNRRLKKLALRKKTTGKLPPCELRDKIVLAHSSDEELNLKPKQQLVARWKKVDGKLVCQWVIT